MSHLARLLFLLLLAAGSLAAAEKPLRVVALHSVLAEIAREVGGDRASVIALVPAGVDPHTFDPSAADIRTVADADLVLAAGLHLETYLDRLAANAGTRSRLVPVGEALPLVLSLPTSAAHTHAAHERQNLSAAGEPDPHWWHSIDNVLFASDLVRIELTRLRPAQAEVFARNAQAYQQRLLALKAWVAREVAGIPAVRRHLVTSHDAFGYLARDWGFMVHPLAGLSTESEPNAKHLAHLIDFIRRERIPAVFAEGSVNPKLAQNFSRETGARLGSPLYADGFGPIGSNGSNYEAMMRHNIGAIVGALAPRK